MILVTPVSFANAANPGLARLSYKVPQLFSVDGSAYEVENLYMLFKARRLREKSTITTAEHVKEFLKWRVDNKLAIEDVSDDDFEYYIGAQCGYKTGTGAELSWNTVNGRLSGAYRFLIWCKIKGFNKNISLETSAKSHAGAFHKYKVTQHPGRNITVPTNFLLMEDAVMFIRAMGEVSACLGRTKERNLLMAKLMLQCGARVSEVVNFPEFDLPIIRHSNNSTPARIVGKGGKARFILIPNGLLSDLWAYKDISRQLILERGDLHKHNRLSHGNLFLTEYGAPITVNWVEKVFSKISKVIGVQVNPHLLRHTFGSYHYLLNRDLLFLSTLMGHESVSTTERYYVQVAKLISYTGDYEKLQHSLDWISREVLTK